MFSVNSKCADTWIYSSLGLTNWASALLSVAGIMFTPSNEIASG